MKGKVWGGREGTETETDCQVTTLQPLLLLFLLQGRVISNGPSTNKEVNLNYLLSSLYHTSFQEKTSNVMLLLQCETDQTGTL